MKTIRLKFEQLQTKSVTIAKAVYELDKNGKTKKDASGKAKVKIPAIKEKIEELVTYISPDIKFTNDKAKNEQIAVEILTLLAESYAIAKQQGIMKIGGTDFNINGKFTLYVNVNGKDFSLDDSGVLFVQNREVRLSNIKTLASTLLGILQISDGKSALISEVTFRKALTSKMIELSKTKRLN